MRKLIKWLGSRRAGGCVLAVALLCLASGVTQAQANPANNVGDPPSRVARLSYVAGDVGLLPAGAGDWIDARINRPLTTGDRLSSGSDARAELELGGTTLRLDRQTDVGLLDLGEQLAQLELTQGSLSLSVRHLDSGQTVEIDTPTVALVIDQVGSYRVDIDGDATRVTDFDGNATVYGESNSQRDLQAGRRYSFGDSSLASVTVSDIDDRDNFDAWSDRRDHRHTQSQSRQYVSNDVVGYQDLDQYGQWRDTDDYGAVWYPDQVAADWAPYRDGHWAYIAPWGWSWVDASPWGYAPYHYGRWAYTQRGWGWIPGPRDVRPVYAPALVAFVGGGGWSAGIGSQPVGWFPLGPGEIYSPWYHCDRNYYTRVNVTNIRVTRNTTNVAIINRVNSHYGHYRDHRPRRDEPYLPAQGRRGFSAMPGREFAAGRRAQAHLIQVDQRQLASAQMMPHGDELPPAGADHAQSRSSHVRRLPTDGFRRGVVARQAPPLRPERRIGSDNRLIAPQVSTVSSHVRLLDRRAGAAGSSAWDNRPPMLQTSSMSADAPARQRRNAAGERSPQAGFPSERFAFRPGRNNAGDNRLTMPKTSSLPPDAPVYQRRNAPIERAPPPEFASERFGHRQRRDPAGDHRPPLRAGSNVISNEAFDQPNPSATFVQRPQRTPRAARYDQDRAAMRPEPPPRMVREVRQQSPAPAAAQRAEAAPAQRHSQAKSERTREPRRHRDGQQQ